MKLNHQPFTFLLENTIRFLAIFTFLLISGTHIPVFAGAQKGGGTLYFGTENEFAGFEVIKSSGRLAINGSIAANTIMEPLFRMGSGGKLIPVLGQSITKSDDGKQWTINLRKGVVFHDGTPFDANAVVAHWSRMINPENRFRGKRAMMPIQSVEKIDKHTIRFNLKHPWLPFERTISGLRSLGTLIPSPKSVEQGTQLRSPVGTGPFRFKEWKSGDSFTVVKNPDYWQTGLPYLDRIIFKPMPDNQTRIASLKTGQLDIIWMDRGNILKKARADTDLFVYQSEENGAEIFVLNTTRPPLDNVNVRRALAHAHRQDLHVRIAYQDSIPVVHNPFGESCNCEDDEYIEHDAQKAKDLLKGVAALGEIELLHSSSKRGRDIGEISQQLFKNAGVSVKPVGLKFGPVIKKVLSGEYQISTWRISSRPDQGPALFLAFHSKSRANFSRYKNPEMDRLLIAQRMETDPVKRQDILCRISRLINRDVPIIYRGGMRNHVIARKQVKGISEMVHGIVRFHNAWVDK